MPDPLRPDTLALVMAEHGTESHRAAFAGCMTCVWLATLAAQVAAQAAMTVQLASTQTLIDALASRADTTLVLQRYVVNNVEVPQVTRRGSLLASIGLAQYAIGWCAGELARGSAPMEGGAGVTG